MFKKSKLLLVPFVSAVLCLCGNVRAELTAPVFCEAGELAVIESSTKATWTVYPVEYRTAIYVVEDGTKCIFASPRKGAVTIIAASVSETDSVAEIDTHTLYNGVEPTDTNNDGGNTKPDKVVTDTLEGTVQVQIESVVSNNKEAEIKALQECFAETVSGIKRGTIRTPEGARATFRALWVSKCATISTESLSKWSDAITAISAKIDNTSLSTISADYEKITATLQKYTTAKAAQGAVEATPKSPSKSTNPNGNCPTGTCPNVQNNTQMYRRGGFVRW